jgi:hypothetical protein
MSEKLSKTELEAVLQRSFDTCNDLIKSVGESYNGRSMDVQRQAALALATGLLQMVEKLHVFSGGPSLHAHLMYAAADEAATKAKG